MGIIFAAIPGLTVSMGIILLLPFTFHMASVTSMSLLVGVFVGGMTGAASRPSCSTSPATPPPSSRVWTATRSPARVGPGVALGVAFFSSFLGGLFSLVCLVTIAPQLADFALKFGAPELASLVLLGLCLICGFAQTSMSRPHLGRAGPELRHRGHGPHRFDSALHVFRRADSAGVSFLPVMIGLFAVPEIISGCAAPPSPCRISRRACATCCHHREPWPASGRRSRNPPSSDDHRPAAGYG